MRSDEREWERHKGDGTISFSFAVHSFLLGHSVSLTLIIVHTHPHIRTRTHTHSNTSTKSHSYRHIETYKLIHTHTHTYTYTDKHTQNYNAHIVHKVRQTHKMNSYSQIDSLILTRFLVNLRQLSLSLSHFFYILTFTHQSFPSAAFLKEVDTHAKLQSKQLSPVRGCFSFGNQASS